MEKKAKIDGYRKLKSRRRLFGAPIEESKISPVSVITDMRNPDLRLDYVSAERTKRKLPWGKGRYNVVAYYSGEVTGLKQRNTRILVKEGSFKNKREAFRAGIEKLSIALNF